MTDMETRRRLYAPTIGAAGGGIVGVPVGLAWQDGAWGWLAAGIAGAVVFCVWLHWWATR